MKNKMFFFNVFEINNVNVETDLCNFLQVISGHQLTCMRIQLFVYALNIFDKTHLLSSISSASEHFCRFLYSQVTYWNQIITTFSRILRTCIFDINVSLSNGNSYENIIYSQCFNHFLYILVAQSKCHAFTKFKDIYSLRVF